VVRLIHLRSYTGACLRTRNLVARLVDRDKLKQDLAHASLRLIVIPNATHFVHLERSERGRQLLLNEVLEFLRR
jgi:pimeloyl-ACP methyl ester carboxylesterase